MSMVPSFSAVQVQTDGKLKVVRSFTCDTRNLTDLLSEDDAASGKVADWLDGYDPDQGPTGEHCLSADEILPVLQWVSSRHGDSDEIGYDLDGLIQLSQYAKESGAKLVVTYV